MAAVLVRNISDKAHNAWKKRAKANGTSVQAELLALIEANAVPEKAQVGLGTRLAEIGRKYGPFDLEIRRDKTPVRVATFE